MSTPVELLDKIEEMDFDYFINEALSHVPDGFDIREGAIMYDALAPASHVISEYALKLHEMLLNTYTQTARGEFLDYRAAERGLSRNKATYTQVLAKFTDTSGQAFNVDLGARFSALGIEPIYYKVSKKRADGMYEMTAETAGNNANRYTGQILPIDAVSDLGFSEIIDVEIPARDDESDDDLRKRILAENLFTRYGGNVADYIGIFQEMSDVGAVQVYPTWNGGGTVKLVILNNDFKRPSEGLIEKVQQAIDPQDMPGDGYGLAPIGHTVTVAAPTPKTIKFDIQIETESQLSVSDVESDVKKAVSDYIDKVNRERWSTVVGERKYSVTVYRSQLIAEVLNVPGVVNVAVLNLNDEDKDIAITSTNKLQEMPVVGGVNVTDVQG